MPRAAAWPSSFCWRTSTTGRCTCATSLGATRSCSSGRPSERGLAVTCEATPHHLFLSQDDIPTIGERRAEVRPRLAAPSDRQALWDNLAVIDCFATDHAPHTAAEKDSEAPPPGFPGLETALGLLWLAVADGRLTEDDLVARMHTNPRRIFGLPEQPETWIEVDPRAAWEVHGARLNSRCGWSPFEGWRLPAQVRRVILRGRPAFEDGRVLAAARKWARRA